MAQKKKNIRVKKIIIYFTVYLIVDVEINIFGNFAHVADLIEELLTILVVLTESRGQYKLDCRIVRNLVYHNEPLVLIQSRGQLSLAYVTEVVITMK
jgi:hypothetical protein